MPLSPLPKVVSIPNWLSILSSVISLSSPISCSLSIYILWWVLSVSSPISFSLYIHILWLVLSLGSPISYPKPNQVFLDINIVLKHQFSYQTFPEVFLKKKGNICNREYRILYRIYCVWLRFIFYRTIVFYVLIVAKFLEIIIVKLFGLPSLPAPSPPFSIIASIFSVCVAGISSSVLCVICCFAIQFVCSMIKLLVSLVLLSARCDLCSFFSVLFYSIILWKFFFYYFLLFVSPALS